MSTEEFDRERRATVHRALGDANRLAIVEALALGDLTPGELGAELALPWNLLAFHLGVLADARLVERHRSAGDGRRRYVRLRAAALDGAVAVPRVRAERPLFVCTHNSARSQFAAALWRRVAGRPASSAGSDPAPSVHPLAVAVAGDHGLDLTRARPGGYATVTGAPDLVVSVCDRALEAGLPFGVARLHWSVPDPALGERPAFEAAFAEIAERVDRLAAAAA
jgi:protein-tyrosine-phosphatase